MGFSMGIEDADRDVCGRAWTSENAYSKLTGLTRCGSRFAGTESEMVGIDWLKGQYEELGLSSIRTDPFTYPGWKRGSLSLDILSPQEKKIEPALALSHSPTAEVEGQLASARCGTAAEFASIGDSLAGKIVIVDGTTPVHIGGRSLPMKERYNLAVEAGAIGFIWMRDQGGFLPEAGSLPPGCSVPGVSIGRESGQELLRLLRSGPVRVKLSMENTAGPMESRNVAGDLQSEKNDTRMLVVGAHFDGLDINEGALDNGYGVAVALEAARLLSPHAHLFNRSIRFVMFAAEELGLRGSRAFVEQSDEAGELDRVDFMLNLDVLRRGEGALGFGLQAWPELLPVFHEVFSAMGIPAIVDVVPRKTSDQFPFMEKGIPSGYARVLERADRTRHWAHTSADTLDKVPRLHLKMDSMIVSRVLLHLAMWSDKWPAKRYTPEQVRSLLGGQQ